MTKRKFEDISVPLPDKTKSQYDRYHLFDALLKTLSNDERRLITGFADEDRRFEKFNEFLVKNKQEQFNLTDDPIGELKGFLSSRNTIEKVKILHRPNISLKTFHPEISQRTEGTYLLFGERAKEKSDFQELLFYCTALAPEHQGCLQCTKADRLEAVGKPTLLREHCELDRFLHRYEAFDQKMENSKGILNHVVAIKATLDPAVRTLHSAIAASSPVGELIQFVEHMIYIHKGYKITIQFRKKG